MRKFLTLLVMVAFTSLAMAQNKTVTGKVTDEKGVPVANASVVVKGTTKGVSTGTDGSFSISVPSSSKILIITSVGFAPLETSIKAGVLNVVLQSNSASLEEVVVVGYGTQKKATVTSSQVKVGGDKVENVPFSSVDQTLQGKVAGLQSITNSGQPGANQQVRIRGIGSISASAQPLYVVDGVQINTGDLSRSNTTSNTLAGINPDDIDRIDVLKDAAATAIYGSRGSNGVIIITTKRGKSGKTQFQLSTEVGSNNFTNAPANSRPADATEWLTLAREGMVNGGYSAATVTSTLHTYGDTSNINTDWFSLITRTGQQEQVNLSASGGNEKTTFFASGGYFVQEASVIGSNTKRFSGTVAIKNKATEKLSFDLSLSASYQNQNSPLGSSAFSNPIMGIYFLRPTQNPYNADGSLNISRVGALNFQSGVTHNPLYTISHNIYNTRVTQAKPNLLTEYAIIKGLKFSSRIGVDYNNLEEFQYWNPNNGDGYAYSGYGFATYTRYFLTDWTNQLNYTKNFLKNDLSVDVRVGTEAISNNYYGMTESANAYTTDKLSSLANASVYVSATNNGSDYKFSSEFASANVGYKNKYILSGSFRRDGSSRFGPNSKYGNFYSVGGSWNISEENFMKNVGVISLLKLRASHGISGNAEIGNYTQTALQVSGYNYNGGAGTAYETVGNETLKWEKTKQTDIGLEVGLLKDRINLVVDVYKRVGDGLLYAAPVSLTTGFSTKTSNIASLENKGIELTLNASPIVTKNFKWEISANITRNSNKILSLPNNNTPIISGLYRLNVGEDYRTFYTYQWAGVNPANGDPLWYADSNKTTTTNDYTKAVKIKQGSASPKYFGGFSNTFTYKNFGATVDFTYSYGSQTYDTWGSYFTDGQYALTYGKYKSNLNRWTTVGQITNTPKYVYGSTNKSNSTSTRYLYSGDYLRLRNLEIFYNAPKSVLEKIKFTSIRFYVRGTNLWTKIYDENLPFDPEQGVNGASSLAIFMTKSVTVGLKVGL